MAPKIFEETKDEEGGRTGDGGKRMILYEGNEG